MKQWILEKEGQLKLFSTLIIAIFFLSVNISWADKIVATTDKNGNKVYENIKNQPIENTPRFTQPQNKNIYIPTIPKIPPALVSPSDPQEQLKKMEIQLKKELKKAEEQAAEGLLLCFLILLIPFITWLTAFIDILENEFTGSNKIIWVLITLFLPIIGSILYCTIGKKQKLSYINYADIEKSTAKRKYNTPKL